MRLEETTGTLHCKSGWPFFELERDGMKPNTERVVDEDDLFDIQCHARRIQVHRADGIDFFEREITSVLDVTDVMASCDVSVPRHKRLVVISWRHEEARLPGYVPCGHPCEALVRANDLKRYHFNRFPRHNDKSPQFVDGPSDEWGPLL